MTYTYIFSADDGSTSFEYVGGPSPHFLTGNFGPSKNILSVAFRTLGDEDVLQIDSQDQKGYNFLFSSGAFLTAGSHRTLPGISQGMLTVSIAYSYTYAFSTPSFDASFQYTASAVVAPPMTLSDGTPGFSESHCASVDLKREVIAPGMGAPIMNDVIVIQFRTPGPVISQTYLFPMGTLSTPGSYQTSSEGIGKMTITAT